MVCASWRADIQLQNVWLSIMMLSEQISLANFLIAALREVPMSRMAINPEEHFDYCVIECIDKGST